MFFDVKSSHFSTHKMTSKKIRRIAFSVIDVSEGFSLPLTQNYSVLVYETDIPMNITVQATYTTCGTILTQDILVNRIESSLNFNCVTNRSIGITM